MIHYQAAMYLRNIIVTLGFQRSFHLVGIIHSSRCSTRLLCAKFCDAVRINRRLRPRDEAFHSLEIQTDHYYNRERTRIVYAA